MALCLLLLVPAAAADSPDWLTIDRQIVLPFSSVEWSQSTTRTQDFGEGLQFDADCQASTFNVDAANNEFEFREDSQGAGCGTLSTRLRPPPGAQSMLVDFEINRHYGSVVTPTPPSFAQMLRVSSGGELLHEVELFDLEDRQFGFVAHSPLVDLPPGPVTVDWWFSDDGFRGDAPLGTLSFYSNVIDIGYRFPGHSVEVAEVRTFSVAGTSNLDAVTTIDVALPEVGSGFGQRLSMEFPAGHGLRAIVAPDGSNIPAHRWSEQEMHGIRQVDVDEELLAEYGPGIYELQFNIALTFRPSMGVSMTLGLLGLGQVVSLGLTSSSYFATRRTLRSIGTNVGTYALVALTASVALGLALVIWLFTTSAHRFAGSWPMSVPSFIVLGYLIATATALLVIWQMLRSTARVAKHQLDLERSNRELDEFAHIVTHDLRAPLRTVSTFTGLLQKKHGDELTEEAQEFVELVNGGAVRMAKLLDAVGHYSRVGRRELMVEEVNLKKLVDDVRRDLRRDLIDTDARLNASDLPSVRCEPALMRELLLNLVQNAIKFRHPTRRPVITIRGKRTAAGLMLTVQDNGQGIEERELRHIFEPFQRGTASAAVPGTGMGLAVCRRIAERHGGRLGVESEPGVGTTFFLHLPDA